VEKSESKPSPTSAGGAAYYRVRERGRNVLPAVSENREATLPWLSAISNSEVCITKLYQGE
jgi:hypothetical protein